MSRRPLYKSAEYVRDSIEQLDVRINPSSRIGEHIRLFCNKDGGAARLIENSDTRIFAAIEAMRDIRQLEFIFENIDQVSRPTDFIYRLKQLLKDSPVFNADSNDKGGRNRQAEFFIIAACAKAGLTPEFNESPDIRCFVGRTEYAVAVKRVKSESNLVEEMSRAADQIEQTRLPGIIAVDSSLAFNPANDTISKPIPERRFNRSYRKALRAKINRHECRLRECTRPKGVLGIVFHDHQIRNHPPHGWELASMYMEFSTAIPGQENQRRDRQRRSFWKSYKKGLPEDE